MRKSKNEQLNDATLDIVRGLMPQAKDPDPVEEVDEPSSKRSPTKKDLLYALERKTKKLMILLKPSDYEKLKQIAEARNVSANEMIGKLINEYKIKKR